MEEGLLKKLVVDSGSSFLGIKKKNGDPLPRVVGLYGANEEILMQFRDQMQIYFEEKGEKVQINLAKKGYSIDVGFLLGVNKSLQ